MGMINHAHTPCALVLDGERGRMNLAPTDAKSPLQLPFERLVQDGGQQGMQFGGGLRLQQFLVRVGLRGGAEGQAVPVSRSASCEGCADGLIDIGPQ